jgi:hypothetical protein
MARWEDPGDGLAYAFPYSENVGFVGFDAGYVGFGNSDVGPWASTSVDGRTWVVSRLAKLTLPCGATSGPIYPDADLAGGASNGHEVILVGAEQLRDPQACPEGAIRAMVWVSSDGQTWQRSTDFAELGRLNSRATQIWPVPHGWQALVDEPMAGVTSLWESTDGLAWREGTLHGGQTWTQLNEQEGFLALDDDQTWRPVAYPEACDRGTVVPPAASSEPWILFRSETTCVSRDLTDWQSNSIDAPSGWNLYSWAHTRYGTIVSGSTTDCVCDDPSQYVSSDGLAWTRVSDGLGMSLMADGPAGVLGITGASDEPQTVWLLEPQ